MANRKTATRRKIADNDASPARPKLTPVPSAVRENWARPSFTFIDQYTMGKAGPKGPNSDRILHQNARYSVVADGVGPDGGPAAQCVVDVIAQQPVDASQRQIADAITRAMQAHGWTPKPGERMMASTAAILSHHHAKIWLVGDARAVIVFEDRVEVHERSDEFDWDRHLVVIRTLYNRLFLKNRNLKDDVLYENDPGHTMLKEFFNEQHGMANEPGEAFKYSVFCAKPLPDSMLYEVSVPHDALSVVLMSDGFPIHTFERQDYQSVEAMEWALSLQNGYDPHAMGKLAQDDGTFANNPGIKGIARDTYTGTMATSYDDASCILLRVI